MALTRTQRFLLQACRDAGREEYFRWTSVGVALGMTEAESRLAVDSLDQRDLVRTLSDGNARLLQAGKRLAATLEVKLRTSR